MTARLNGQKLPDGWVWTTTSEACTAVKDGTHDTPKYVDEGVPLITSKNLRPQGLDMDNIRLISLVDHNDISQRSGVDEGDVLFAMIGTIGNPVLVPATKPFSIKNVGLFKKNPEVVESRYLAYWLASSDFQTILIENELIRGTTQKFVPLGNLRVFPIPLAPLNEQRRIVAAIETQFTRLDAAVTALKRSQANLKRYRAAVLKAACEGRLVPTEAELAQAEGRSYEPASVLLERILAERRRKWEAENPKKKYQEPVAPDTSKLPELPEGWCWTTVEQLADHEQNSITDGPFGSKLKTSHYTDEGPRVIRLQNIGDGIFHDEYAHISEEHFNNLTKHQVFAGDIVIAALGTELPRACIMPSHVGLAIVKADCMRFKPHSKLISTAYAKAALNSKTVRKIASQTVHGIGRPRLNQQEVKEIIVPLPPLAEQLRIVSEVERRLSLIDQLEKTIKADLARANRLRQSILKRAFAGQLVPQDPNDEPASVLLERIQGTKQGKPVQPPLITGKE